MLERIYPIDYRAYEIEKRELWFSVFEDELVQLHKVGFVHRCLKRPSSLSGQAFDNIMLTATGLRLVDVGIAALRHQVGDLIFKKYFELEMLELAVFKEYFLNR